MSATLSVAGTTARIAVILQIGWGFLSGGRRGATIDNKEDCVGHDNDTLDKSDRIYLYPIPNGYGGID